MKIKLCQICDAGLAGYYILWGRKERREDYVSALSDNLGVIFCSEVGYLIKEGRRGKYDVVSVWPSKEAARERLWERFRAAEAK